MTDSVFMRLFGAQKEAASTTVANDTEAAKKQSIELQEQIDVMNSNIQEWNVKKEHYKRKAIEYKRANNMVMCKQMMGYMNMMEDQINSAMTSLSQLATQQSGLVKSIMMKDTNMALKKTTGSIKNNIASVDIGELQDTLMEKDSVDEQMKELSYHMNQSATPFNSSELDKAIENLDISDDTEEIVYPNLPTKDLVMPSIPSKTTTTSSSPAKKQSLFEKGGFFIK